MVVRPSALQRGAIKMRRRHRWSVSVRSTDDASHRSYPAQLSVKRDCQGGSPVPLDRVLPTFARTKVGPRRVGVQAVTLRRLRDAFRRPQTIPCRVGIQILISKRPRPAARRLPTWSKISSAAHSSANRSPAPARRDPSPPQNIIIIPSLTSPIKPTIYAILAQ